MKTHFRNFDTGREFESFEIVFGRFDMVSVVLTSFSAILALFSVFLRSSPVVFILFSVVLTSYHVVLMTFWVVLTEF